MCKSNRFYLLFFRLYLQLIRKVRICTSFQKPENAFLMHELTQACFLYKLSKFIDTSFTYYYKRLFYFAA